MAMPRRLNTHLLTHSGATAFLPKAEADDATPSGLENTIEPWLEKLWAALKKEVASPSGAAAAPAAAAPVAAPAAVVSDRHPRLAEIGFAVKPASQPALPSLKEADTLPLAITAARYLSAPEAVKTVIHLTLSSEQIIPAFLPGDSVTIRCPNPVEGKLVFDVFRIWFISLFALSRCVVCAVAPQFGRARSD